MPVSELIKTLAETFAEKIPFNKLIGMEFEEISPERCCVRFAMKEELIGNYVQGILHGGVIASAIDVAGGAMAAIGSMNQNPETHLDEFREKLSRLGTIDLRIDFVRPGRGEMFFASAHILRAGNKVAVARMELHNEDDVLIAAGTGTYLVG